MTGDRVQVDLKYVKPQPGRDGQTQFWYFRRNGRYWRLPGEPLSDEFMEAYRQLLAGTVPAKAAPVRKAATGSFKALVNDYLASPEFCDRKPATQRIYRIILDPLVEKHGHKPVALIERRHIKAWRDAKAGTPGMANMLVKVMGMLLKYAMDNDYREDNPAANLTKFKLGEHRAWTHDELAAFERRWAPGTMQRRAYVLARFTGQRCGDVATMTRACRQDGYIRVRQQKTGKVLHICEHSAISAELALGDQSHMSLLVKANGKAFDGESLSPWFGEAIEAGGLPDDCVMHGLRKVAARDLAEAGCTEHEIAAVTGQSLTEVERYTRAASQIKLNKAAILKLERNEKRTAAGKPAKRSVVNGGTTD